MDLRVRLGFVKTNSRLRAINEKIAATMLNARRAKGLTQKEVAQELGISQGALSKIERAKLVPTAAQWFLFCLLTGTCADSVFSDGEIDGKSEKPVKR